MQGIWCKRTFWRINRTLLMTYGALFGSSYRIWRGVCGTGRNEGLRERGRDAFLRHRLSEVCSLSDMKTQTVYIYIDVMLGLPNGKAQSARGEICFTSDKN